MGLISATSARSAALGALFALATAAGAQPAAADTAINGITAGQCTVTVTVSNPAAHTTSEIDLDLNGLWLARQTIANRRELTFRLKAPLEHLDEVRIREAGPIRLGDWSAPVVVQPGTGRVECSLPKQQTDDTRDPFQATFYVGAAFDNFAPASVGGYTTTPGGYLNSEKGGSSSTRTVAGVDFEFRAVGDEQSARQLWLVGGTVHGVRSGDVDCTAAPNDRPPVCQTLGTRFGVQNPSAAFLYALEHATSFEAYLIPRWEFATLQPGTIFPSRAYVSFRMGVDMLSGDAHEAADFYHLGAGILTPSGPFKDSYIEAGVGQKRYHGFPWYATLGQNAPSVIRLDERQANLLANLTAWAVTDPWSVDTMCGALGAALGCAQAQ
jgi:hypothetical protein